MSQPLSTGGFRFFQPDEIEALVGELFDDAEDRYIYEVDLHYPQHLHDAPDYPLSPESLEIDSDMYSPAVFPQTAPPRKQSTWLKTYIDFNTHQRSLARSSFLKDFFKLMNNSAFGKTQENLRKCVQVELITDTGKRLPNRISIEAT